MGGRHDWEAVRAAYAGGSSVADLSARYGLAPATLRRRCRQEGWTRLSAACQPAPAAQPAPVAGVPVPDQEALACRGAVAQPAAATVTDGVAASTPDPRPAATRQAADVAGGTDERLALRARHREEWARQRHLLTTALAAGDLEQIKLAKLAAEVLKIRQEGERRAWELGDGGEATGAAPLSRPLSPAVRALLRTLGAVGDERCALTDADRTPAVREASGGLDAAHSAGSAVSHDHILSDGLDAASGKAEEDEPGSCLAAVPPAAVDSFAPSSPHEEGHGEWR